MKLVQKKYTLLLPMRCVLFIACSTILSFGFGITLIDLSKWWSIICSILNIVTILLLLVFCKRSTISYAKLINYTRGSTTIRSVIGIALMYLLIGLGGMYFAGFLCYNQLPYLATVMIQPIPIQLAIINTVILPVSTTFAEDGLYLGIGVNNMKKDWMAIFVPAFFYALQHCFIPMILDFQYIMYRFLSFIPLTIVICYLYRKNRNPVPFMIGHGLINLATVTQIVITSFSPELFKIMNGL